jgi:hypothetical protein
VIGPVIALFHKHKMNNQNKISAIYDLKSIKPAFHFLVPLEKTKETKNTTNNKQLHTSDVLQGEFLRLVVATVLGIGSRWLGGVGVIAVVVSGKQLLAASKEQLVDTCVFLFPWLPEQQRTQTTTSVLVMVDLFARLLSHYLQSFADKTLTIVHIGTPARLNNKKTD